MTPQWRSDKVTTTRVLSAVLFSVWGLVVLVGFVLYSSDLVGGALGLLKTVALAALSIYTFWFIGFRLCGSLAREAPPLERSVLEWGAGTATVMGAVFLAGVLGGYQPGLPWLLFAGALLGNHRRFIASLRERWSTSARPPGSTVCALVLAAVGALTFFVSLAPCTAQDALVYHLALPARYVAAGGLEYIPESFFAQFPQNIEMLFTLGLLADGDSLAQWYHWMFGAAATAAVAALSLSLDRRANGWLAAAIFASIPTAALISGWAYVDLAIVFYCVLSTLCLLRWVRGCGVSWLWVAAVFAGVAAGSKYTAGLQGLLLVGSVGYAGFSRGWPWRRTFLLATGCAAMVGLVASPWWIKNLVNTGNPFFPFAYSLFGGEHWDSHRAAVLSLSLEQWGGEKGLLSTLLLPWRVTMDGEFFSIENFDGVIGCVFLAAAPLLFWGFKTSQAHRIVGCFFLVEIVLWSALTHQIRFLLPALALAASVLGATLPIFFAETAWRRVATGLVQAALVFNVLIISLYFATHNPLPVVLGLESDDTYLTRELPGRDYRVFQYLNQNLPADSYVLFGSLGNPGFLCKRRYHADAFFENYTLNRLLEQTDGADSLLGAFRARGFTHLLFRWENVLDPEGQKSAILKSEQRQLVAFLNRHARLLAQESGTCLFVVGKGIGRGEKDGQR